MVFPGIQEFGNPIDASWEPLERGSNELINDDVSDHILTKNGWLRIVNIYGVYV